MDEQTLRDGFSQLDSLAREEYHESLFNIAKDSDEKRGAIRVGRLIGVMMKEPFAKSQSLSEPSRRTGAYRAWHLADAESFDGPQHKATWQYKTLDQIRHELVAGAPYHKDMSVQQLARDAQYETGFFGYLARTLRQYICRDPEIRKKVEDAIKEVKGDADIPTVSPELVVGSAGLALGIYLVQVVPVLGLVGAPVIAGVVIILYTLGVSSFCEWSDSLRTDQDEQY